RADLLLVKGDPALNIADTRNIVAVWKSGHAANRAAFATELASGKKAAPAGPAALLPRDGPLSSLQDGGKARSVGGGWSRSTHPMYGGKSVTDYKVVSDGANGTAKSLEVTGEIIAGFAFPWAGAMYSPGAQQFSPANLSKASGIRFWARGDGQTYRVLY